MILELVSTPTFCIGITFFSRLKTVLGMDVEIFQQHEKESTVVFEYLSVTIGIIFINFMVRIRRGRAK